MGKLVVVGKLGFLYTFCSLSFYFILHLNNLLQNTQIYLFLGILWLPPLFPGHWGGRQGSGEEEKSPSISRCIFYFTHTGNSGYIH